MEADTSAGELRSVSAMVQTIPALYLVAPTSCGQQFAVKCMEIHLGGQGSSAGLLVKVKLVLSQGKTCL